MGIEPTKHLFRHLNGFEDRGGHQASKRFRKKYSARIGFIAALPRSRIAAKPIAEDPPSEF